MSSMDYSDLVGKLPENVSTTFSDLSLAVIDTIPAEVLKNSLKSYSDDENLTKQQVY